MHCLRPHSVYGCTRTGRQPTDATLWTQGLPAHQSSIDDGGGRLRGSPARAFGARSTPQEANHGCRTQSRKTVEAEAPGVEKRPLQWKPKGLEPPDSGFEPCLGIGWREKDSKRLRMKHGALVNRNFDRSSRHGTPVQALYFHWHPFRRGVTCFRLRSYLVRTPGIRYSYPSTPHFFFCLFVVVVWDFS